MALFTSLSALSQTPASNAPDGSVDAPSTIDDQLRLLASFTALLRDEAHVYVSAIAGTNTITGTIPTNPTSYVVGRVYRFVAAADNTGAVTLNFNSLGAKSLLKVGNAALTGGELQGTAVYQAVYDGVNFQLVGMYGFKNSIGTSGYQYLPSGLILQWGTATGSASGAQAVSLPIAFPSAIRNVQVTAGISGQPIFGTTDSQSTSSFSFSMWNLSGSRVAVGAFWFALGN